MESPLILNTVEDGDKKIGETLVQKQQDNVMIVFSLAAFVCTVCVAMPPSNEPIMTFLLAALLITSQFVSSVGFSMRWKPDGINKRNYFYNIEGMLPIFLIALFLIPFPFAAIIIYSFETGGELGLQFVQLMKSKSIAIDEKLLIFKIYPVSDSNSVNDITSNYKTKTHFSLNMKFFYLYRQYFLFALQCVVFYIPLTYVFFNCSYNKVLLLFVIRKYVLFVYYLPHSKTCVKKM